MQYHQLLSHSGSFQESSLLFKNCLSLNTFLWYFKYSYCHKIYCFRASNAARIPGEPYPIEPDKPRLVASSVRQVHPVCEDKAQLIVYDKRSSIVVGDSAPKRPPPAALSIEANASPPPYPKRASLDSNPSPTSYPLAPNICVEAGRIEFIKQSPDGGTASPPSTPSTPRIGARITVTRGQQTVDDEYEEMKVGAA